MLAFTATARVCVAGEYYVAQLAPNASDSNPGTFGLLDEDMNIICGKDRLQIERLKPAGSHLMDFKDFINGRSAAPGDLFLPLEQARKNG